MPLRCPSVNNKHVMVITNRDLIASELNPHVTLQLLNPLGDPVWVAPFAGTLSMSRFDACIQHERYFVPNEAGFKMVEITPFRVYFRMSHVERTKVHLEIKIDGTDFQHGQMPLLRTIVMPGEHFVQKLIIGDFHIEKRPQSIPILRYEGPETMFNWAWWCVLPGIPKKIDHCPVDPQLSSV